MFALKIKISTLLEQLNPNNVLLLLNLIYNPLVKTDSKSEFNNVTSDINYLLDAVYFKPARGAAMEVACDTYLEQKTIEQAQIDVLVKCFHDPDLWDNLLDYDLYLVPERGNSQKLFGFVERNATEGEQIEAVKFGNSLSLDIDFYDIVVIE